MDFGATREFHKEFIDSYIEIINGAALKNNEKIIKLF